MKSNTTTKFLAISIITYAILAACMETGVSNGYISGIIVSILINIIMAVSLAFVTGYLGELVLGHAGFMGIGAYVSAIITMNMDLPMFIEFPLAIICGGIFAALVGILIGIPALRLRGDYLGIITLGFGEIIRIVLNNLKITNGAQGLSGVSSYSNFTITFIVVILTIVVLYKIINSRQGRVVVAIRENEIAADCVGISTFYYKTMAFSIAALFAGIGGGLYAHYHTVINPTSFGFTLSIEYLIIVVLGGMGNLFGTILAGIILGVLNEALRGFSEYRTIVYSLVLIAIMISRSKGITLQTIKSKFNIKLPTKKQRQEFASKGV
ncbi:ABC transporter [Candidatus Epulonipiscium fishelsonii]|uniref:ABC transporter n=1 Tax=Candidatus Epulonipiscium fishelsonii TaxID=77094 RepID=A0ACC8X7X5_9FIRM|nr:ABC transporter [Epulopiscium sp. SCG-B11WGA-EpuloA1]ONI40701.1 ABC transporter [Epulopiscium sp. SCG-B05WGA-EpuloA1]